VTVDPAIAAAKRALRARVLAQRDAVDPATRQAAVAAITARLCVWLDTAAPRALCSYASFGSEFDTGALHAALRARRIALVLPRVIAATPTVPRHLAWFAVPDPSADLVRSAWGIDEPDPQRCAAVTLDAVEAVLVPGVAFDASGARLGYGGGFYDRQLASAPALPRIVAAFDLQVVDAVPVDAHDARVDRVITESRAIDCPPRA
jgi:5-formyltetrahydrofolate cyclo-ligase